MTAATRSRVYSEGSGEWRCSGHVVQVLKPLSPRAGSHRSACLSFVLPLALCGALVSYVPWIWHPQVLHHRSRLASTICRSACAWTRKPSTTRSARRRRSAAPPQGLPANPIYLPAPHEVADSVLHLLHHAAAHAGRQLAASKPVAQHSDHLLGLRDLLDRSACRSASCAAPMRPSRASPSPSSSSSAICRRRHSARSPSPFSASMTGRRSPSSSSARFFQQVLIIANTTRKLDVAPGRGCADARHQGRAKLLGARRRSPAFCPISTAISASCSAGPGPI